MLKANSRIRNNISSIDMMEGYHKRLGRRAALGCWALATSRVGFAFPSDTIQNKGVRMQNGALRHRRWVATPSPWPPKYPCYITGMPCSGDVNSHRGEEMWQCCSLYRARKMFKPSSSYSQLLHTSNCSKKGRKEWKKMNYYLDFHVLNFLIRL